MMENNELQKESSNSESTNESGNNMAEKKIETDENNETQPEHLINNNERESNTINDLNDNLNILSLQNKAENENKSNQNQKKEKKKEENNEDDDDDTDDYFDPIDEKGQLKIPLKTKNKFTKEDFEIIGLSGKGAYGTVLKAKLKSEQNDKLYAIKTMDVMALDRIKKLYQAYLECDILSQLESPYIVDIFGAFDENRKIFIVMQYLSKGDFSDFIRLNYPIKPDTIQFYAAEIVNFLDYIQSKKIVHRDLKPENIMMNENWHLQVIDFATARVLGKYFDKQKMVFNVDSYYDISETDDLKGNKVAINNDDDDDFEDAHSKPQRRGMTFVGTAEYVSPEVLGDKPAGFGSDIWALGIMIYQMIYNKTPFKEKTNYLIFRKIEQLKIEFGENEAITEEAKDLINKILVKDPTKRLGAGEPGTEFDMAHLKAHPYFKGIKWDKLHKITPPNSENFDYLLNKKKNNKNNVNNNNTSNQKKGSDLGKTTKKPNNEEEQEEVLRKGYLEKKGFWFLYNKRKIILYSTPKLVYIDPTNNQIKGEIYLDRRVKVNHISLNVFEVVTPLRSFRFKSIDGDVLVWEKSIAEAIKTYSK